MHIRQKGAAAIAYLAGAFGVAFFELVFQADWNVESVIEYSAEWPLRLLDLV